MLSLSIVLMSLHRARKLPPPPPPTLTLLGSGLACFPAVGFELLMPGRSPAGTFVWRSACGGCRPSPVSHTGIQSDRKRGIRGCRKVSKAAMQAVLLIPQALHGYKQYRLCTQPCLLILPAPSIPTSIAPYPAPE